VINAMDGTNVAVVNFFVVIVLDLHDLVASRKGPAKLLNFFVARGIKRRLQLNVQGPRTNSTPVHRVQHLDVADRIETKPLGDPCFREFNDASDGGLWILHRYKIEVALGAGRTEVGH
jgi:hypothetical protein